MKTPPPGWAADYIGIPYLAGGRTKEGASCWGIVYLVETGELNRECPMYSDEPTVGDESELAAMVDRERPIWPEIEKGREKTGDIVLLRLVGQDRKPHECHCGIVIRPGRMIHTLRGHNSVSESYDRLRWARRVVSFHRFFKWEGACA